MFLRRRRWTHDFSSWVPGGQDAPVPAYGQFSDVQLAEGDELVDFGFEEFLGGFSTGLESPNFEGFMEPDFTWQVEEDDAD